MDETGEVGEGEEDRESSVGKGEACLLSVSRNLHIKEKYLGNCM